MGRFDDLLTLDTKTAQPAPSPENPAVTHIPKPPANQLASKRASKQTEKEGDQQVSNPANLETNNQTSLQASRNASKHASTPAIKPDIIEIIRKIVKTPAKEEVLYVRVTKEEKDQLGDIEYTYHNQQGIDTSANELGRIAVNFLIADYKANGEQSILAKVLAALNA
jgi:hypothetical protein